MEPLCVVEKCVTELVGSGELAERRLELAGYLDRTFGWVNDPGYLEVLVPPPVLA